MQRILEGFPRFFKPFSLLEQLGDQVKIAEIDVSFGIIGVELHRLEEFFFRFGRLLPAHQSDAVIVAGGGVARGDFNRFFKMSLSRGELVPAKLNPPQVVMRLRVIGENLQRLPVSLFSLGDPVQLGQSGPHVEIDILVFGRFFFGDQELLQCFGVILLVKEDDRLAQVVVGRARFKDIGLHWGGAGRRVG